MTRPLWKWQSRAILEFMAERRSDFLIEATPGAGKTRTGAEIALRLRAAGITPRIISVVPTQRLRKQTADKYRGDCGLQLKWDWKPGDGAFPGGDFCGVAVTYQTVTQNQGLFRSYCNGVPTLVVLDEIHHASRERSWGSALHYAFEPAVHRLMLSGTPFRSDDGAIPFVRYVDGKGVADVSYGYGDALADEVVREVYFPKFGGSMEWVDDDGRREATFADDLDDRGQSRRLRTALMADGGHLGGMLKQAHRDLMQMRDDDPDAAGLVIAIDQEHATVVAGRMRTELGVDPIIAISDDPGATDLIEQFETSGAPWIVAVRMVSEGVDIPRLRSCIYASNIITEMFFRQAVGRVVRKQDDHEQHWAHFYIPDDPRLRQYAADIRKQRDMVAIPPIEPSPQEGTGSRSPTTFVPLSSTAEDAGAVAGEHNLSADELTYAERVKLANTETASLSTLKVALLLKAAKHFPISAAESTTVPQPQDITARLQLLRRSNNKLAKRIAMRWGIEYREVNSSLNRLVGIRSVTQCFTVEALNRRLDFAERWFQSGDLAEAAGD